MGRRLRRLAPAPAAGVGRRGGFSSPAGRPRGEPAVRHGAARERGRRRSAYEAPHGSVAPGPVSNGAESERGRRLRSRARQSWVTFLVYAAQRLGLGLALLRIAADAEAEPRAGRDPLAALLALGDVEEDRASFVVVEEAEALLGEEAVDDADPALLAGRVGGDLVEDGELGREGRVGRGCRLVPHPAGGEGRAAGRERRVIPRQTPQRLPMAGGGIQAPELPRH